MRSRQGWQRVRDLTGEAFLPYNPPDEPYLDQQGREGAVKYIHAYPLRTLVQDYRHNGEEASLELAGQILKFILKPGMWENTTLEGYKGHEHAIFSGHFHANVGALLALLDLAEATQDQWLKQFVREGYENTRRHGAVRMGWFPGYLTPAKFERPAYLAGQTETCAIAEIVQLAVRLSDAGMGDYWDDADAILRNHLSESQYADVDTMREVAEELPGVAECIEDFVGGFGSAEPTTKGPFVWGCCTANGAIGLYYGWHGITRFEDGVATVNLLLNRASPWMDINSYLPYEGKVELLNKGARTIVIRIPSWVEIGQVNCSIDDQLATPLMSGRQLIFDGLAPDATVRLAFPTPEGVERYTLNGTLYKVTYRGSTVVDIEPRDEDLSPVARASGTTRSVPLYQRDHLKADKAPMRTVKRFVADKVLPLQ